MFDALNPAEFRTLSLDARPRCAKNVVQAQTAVDATQPSLQPDPSVKTALPANQGLLSEAELKAASPALWGGIWGGGTDS